MEEKKIRPPSPQTVKKSMRETKSEQSAKKKDAPKIASYTAKPRPMPARKKKKAEPQPPHDADKRTPFFWAAAAIALFLAVFVIRLELVGRVGQVELNAGAHIETSVLQKTLGNLSGDVFAFMKTEDYEKRIKAYSPMIKEVRFEMSFPRTLTVTVVDEDFVYYYDTEDGTRLILNEAFKILAVHDESAYNAGSAPYDLDKMGQLFLTDAVVGELGSTLEFKSKEDLSPFLDSLYARRGTLYERITRLDLRNARNVVFILDDLVRVQLSETTDADFKLDTLSAMMKQEKTLEESIPTSFTFVRNASSGTEHWAVEPFANIYR